MPWIKKIQVEGQKYLYIAGVQIPYQIKENGPDRWFCIGDLEIPYHYTPFFSMPFPGRGSIKSIQYAPVQKLKRKHYDSRELWQDPQNVQQRLEELYEERLGRHPNLDRPQTLTEKLNWIKLHYKSPLLTKCCDKYYVKEYIARTLGSAYHIPTIQAWTSAKDIEFEKLPDSFVLKVNWSSGYNIFVKDKNHLRDRDRRRIIAQIDYWMRPMCNSYFDTFNWGYKDCLPVVYAEEYLDTSNIVREYKVFCFHGKPEFVLIEQNTGVEAGTRVCLDLEGNPLPFRFGVQPVTRNVRIPGDYEQMQRFAEMLSKPFPFVRVDFLGTEQHCLIGEMTFYSGGGFSMISPEGWDEKLGDLLRIK